MLRVTLNSIHQLNGISIWLKSFRLYYFSLVEELVEVVQILLVLICIYDGVNQRPHNKLSIGMDGLKFTVHGDGRHATITHQCWPVESGHPMRWTGQPLTAHTGRNHCLHQTICFLRETKKSPECNSNTAFPCTVEGWSPWIPSSAKMSSLFLPSKLRLAYTVTFYKNGKNLFLSWLDHFIGNLEKPSLKFSAVEFLVTPDCYLSTWSKWECTSFCKHYSFPETGRHRGLGIPQYKWANTELFVVLLTGPQN